MTQVAANFHIIMEKIAEATLRARRDVREVRLLGAAKSQSVESVRAAIGAGLALIGENYVQEAHAKKAQLEAPIEWHMIGHLQRNKVKAALDLFDVVESLDSLALARELDKEGKRRGTVIRAFIEVNLAGEKSKSGIGKSQLALLLDGIAKLDHLTIDGLMTVPPFAEDLNEIRPYFRELRDLREKICERGIANVAPRELSMGMSHDFAVAIEEGATIVRIGTALFGARIT